MNEKKILEKTIGLVYSSKRKMPAHFTSNGERTQSFCIDFEPLNEEDECNMASRSYYSINDYLNSTEISKEYFTALISLGEDLMIGSYIFTKLGGENLLEELREEIIKKTTNLFSTLDGFKEFVEKKDENTLAYLKYCSDFGVLTAKK